MAMRCEEAAFPDGTGQCVLPKGHAGRHVVSGDRPTIAELEQILAQEGEQEIEIAPNGELLAKDRPGYCPKHDVRWSGKVGCPMCQDEAERARAALQEALAPFSPASKSPILDGLPDSEPISWHCTAGQLRAARAALGAPGDK